MGMNSYKLCDMAAFRQWTTGSTRLREGESHSCPGFYVKTISQPHYTKLMSQWSTVILRSWGSRDHSSGQLLMLGPQVGNWKGENYTKREPQKFLQVCDWGSPPLSKTSRHLLDGSCYEIKNRTLLSQALWEEKQFSEILEFVSCHNY